MQTSTSQRTASQSKRDIEYINLSENEFNYYIKGLNKSRNNSSEKDKAVTQTSTSHVPTKVDIHSSSSASEVVEVNLEDLWTFIPSHFKRIQLLHDCIHKIKMFNDPNIILRVTISSPEDIKDYNHISVAYHFYMLYRSSMYSVIQSLKSGKIDSKTINNCKRCDTNMRQMQDPLMLGLSFTFIQILRNEYEKLMSQWKKSSPKTFKAHTKSMKKTQSS